jgi:hypothetical protein
VKTITAAVVAATAMVGRVTEVGFVRLIPQEQRRLGRCSPYMTETWCLGADAEVEGMAGQSLPR